MDPKFGHLFGAQGIPHKLYPPGAAINSDLVLSKAMGAGGASTGEAVLCPSFPPPFTLREAGRPWSLCATHCSIIVVSCTSC